MERRESEEDDHEYQEDDTDPLDEELKKVHDEEAEEGDDASSETPGKPSDAPSKSFVDDPVDFLIPAYVRNRIAKILAYSLQGARTIGNVLWFSSTTAMVLLIPIYYAFSLATAAEKFQYEPSKQVQQSFMHPGSTVGPPNELDTYGVAAADAAESAVQGLSNTVRPNPNLPNSP